MRLQNTTKYNNFKTDTAAKNIKDIYLCMEDET